MVLERVRISSACAVDPMCRLFMHSTGLETCNGSITRRNSIGERTVLDDTPTNLDTHLFAHMHAGCGMIVPTLQHSLGFSVDAGIEDAFLQNTLIHLIKGLLQVVGTHVLV